MTFNLAPSLAWAPGPAEIVLILAALFLVFGAKKLPELARSMGSSINEFTRGLKDAPAEPKALDERKDPERDPERSKDPR
jgi:sec-independent protein translocase protein TatA